MKNLFILFATMLLGTDMEASEELTNYYSRYSGDSYIFTEGNVEFSVYPDGQFDFSYLGNRGTQLNINTPGMSFSFNSGYNYDPYVQYDNYGAVIQIENIPVFYDDYGRIIQAGNVFIRYNNGYLVQLGGMVIHYDNYWHFTHYTGYINTLNRRYIYRPWHTYYTMPYYTYSVVYTTPYRRYYTPVRYTYAYHSTHYNGSRSYANSRRDFYLPEHAHITRTAEP